MEDFWKAGLSRRWHTNADLNHTVDSVGGHGSRVALLLLYFAPNISREAIIEAISHDLGEYKVGDFPAPFKWENPDLAKTISKIEKEVVKSMGIPTFTLTPKETNLIKLCDMLDAWLWCKLHRPNLISRKDWKEMSKAMHNIAAELGVLHQFLKMVR